MYCALRGIKMPARGSLEANIFIAALQRERITELVTWEATMLILGSLFGASGDKLKEGVADMRKQLARYHTHEAYSVKSLAEQLRKKLRELEKDEAQLKKIEAFTVS